MKVDSKARKAVTAALCALLATSPLLGCAGQAKKAQDASSSSMVKDAGEDIESQGKKVPYSKAGTYTVTLREADFQKAEENADQNNDANSSSSEQTNANAEAAEKAKAALEEAKTSRDEAQKALDEAKAAEDKAKADGEQAAAQAQGIEQAIEVADSDQANPDVLAKATEAREQAEQQLAKAEEAVKAAEEEATKLEGQADAAKAEDKKDLTFGDVKAENVKVSYEFTPEGENAQTETREATVNALSNDGGALTLSFTDPDAAANATSSYAVTIGSLKLAASIEVDVTSPTLSVESGGVKSDSQSCDVRIKVADDKFTSGVSAGDITLGGSFREMTVTGVEVSGDTLTAHLSGSPTRDYETEATWTDGQVTVAASGFENSPSAATAYVGVDLPDEAFDLSGTEVLSSASVAIETEGVRFEDDAAKTTLHLLANLGSFNDVKPESITLEGSFAGGRVESVSKDGEDGDLLRMELSFPKGEESEDGYLYAGTVRFADGALTDERGQAAKDVSATLILSPEDMDKAGGDAEEAAKKAAEAKKKEQEAKSKKLGGISEGFKYASGWVEKVDPVLGQVANFGAAIFGMASSYVGGNWVDLAKGGVGFLQMCGIIPAGEKEVTAKDVLDEVKSLRTVVNSIELKTDENTKENRENRYTQTLTRAEKMQDRCASAYVMFQKAAEILASRKDNPMKAPAANASNEEAARYNNALRNVLIEEENKAKAAKADNSMFSDVQETVSAIRKDLQELTKWVSIDKNALNAGANPIDVLDKLLSAKFNWDTQGYYARAAFRAELEATIKNSWAVVSTFYAATDPAVASKYQRELDSVKAALQQIAARPAGMSPEEVRRLNQAGKEINVYSPSIGYAIRHCWYATKGSGWGDAKGDAEKDVLFTHGDERVTNDKIWGYKNRLNGRSPIEDIKLAGLDVDDPSKDGIFRGISFSQRWETNFFTHGLLLDKKLKIYQQMLRNDGSIGEDNTFMCEYDMNTLRTFKNEIYVYSNFYWLDKR